MTAVEAVLITGKTFENVSHYCCSYLSLSMNLHGKIPLPAFPALTIAICMMLMLSCLTALLKMGTYFVSRYHFHDICSYLFLLCRESCLKSQALLMQREEKEATSHQVLHSTSFFSPLMGACSVRERRTLSFTNFSTQW